MQIRRHGSVGDDHEDLRKFIEYRIKCGDHGFCQGIEGQLAVLTDVVAFLLAERVEKGGVSLRQALELVWEYREYEPVP